MKRQKSGPAGKASAEAKPLNPAQDVRKLLGLPKVVQICGRAVTVRGFTWAQLADVIDASWPIIDELTVGKSASLVHALAKNRVSVTKLISLSTGLAVEEIDALPIAEGTQLTTQVWLENEDFFVQELTPLIAAAFGSKTAKSSSNETSKTAAPQASTTSPPSGPAPPTS